MKSNFDEYILQWFNDYIEEHSEDENLMLSLFNTIVDRDEDDSLDDWLGENETVIDWLTNISKTTAEDIYNVLWINGQHQYFDGVPESYDFVLQILTDAAKECNLLQYEFSTEYLEDMANHIVDYDTFLGFFEDLQHGGCQSGMVGMLIYNSDCLDLYKKYCDSMEDYKDDMEDDYGESIRQRKDNHIQHYVWMCWLCYEELAYSIARYLFEDEF